MTDWRQKAACRGATYPDRFSDDDPEIRRSALQSFCSTCPVVYECLQEGLEQEERFCVRGGNDPSVLRQLQNIDVLGKPLPISYDEMTCPYCEAQVKNPGKGRAECEICGMSWEVQAK